jgi:hypothetical protein
MKTRIIFFLTVIFIVNSLYAQIPNSGFENWSNTAGYNTPDDWGNLNPVTNSVSIYTCLKGTPGSPGAAYLKLISKTVTGMGVQPGIAVSGVLNTTIFQAVSGFAYADRPTSLKGKWQFMANGADQGYISVYLSKWDAGLNMRDTIGEVKYLLPGMVMSWQNFTIPLSYNSNEIPDSAIIIFSASGSIPVDGSYLYIDNLSFFGSTVGMEEQFDQAGLMIFPNPVIQNKLVVDLKNRDVTVDHVDIMDLHGKMLIRKETTNQRFPITMDVSNLHIGSYFLRITSPSGTFGSKFIKQ